MRKRPSKYNIFDFSPNMRDPERKSLFDIYEEEARKLFGKKAE
jgi:hypothetical protein